MSGVVAARPEHGAIVQYFRRAKFIDRIVGSEAFHDARVEMIVNDDSRTDHAGWLAALPATGFLARARPPLPSPRPRGAERGLRRGGGR